MNSIYPHEQFRHESRRSVVTNSNVQPPAYFDVMGMVKRRIFLILALGFLGVLGGAIFFFNATKIYESSASLYVEDASPLIGPTRTSGSDNNTGSSIEKFIEVLGSDRIVGPAIVACDPETLKCFSVLEPEDNAIEFIKDQLFVRSSDKKAESGVITVSLTSTYEDEARRILVSILNVFDEFVSATAAKSSHRNVQTIAKMKNDNSEELAEVQREIDALMAQPHIQSRDGKVLNQHQQRIAIIQEELHQKDSELVKLESLREQIEQAHRDKKPIEDIVVESLSQVNESPLRNYVETQQQLIRLQIEESELSGDFGKSHPDLRRIHEQIQLLKNMRQRQLLSIFGSNTHEETTQIDFYSVATEHLERKISRLISHRSKLDKAMADAKERSIEIEKDCDQLAFLLGQREALSERSMQITDRSIQFGVLEDTKKYDVELINFPTTAQKVFPKLKFCLPIGAMLGCGLGFCWGLLKETREETFRSSKEISDHLELPVLAEIGFFDTRRLKSDDFPHVGGSVIALHRPLSVPGEVYKALRTEILFDGNGRSARVFQVTSPQPADGKSSVAANLAVTLAQSGRRVVLVDCDLRRPAIAKLFSLDETTSGLTSLLLDEAEIEDVIEASGVENLSLICSGERYSNPADILTSDGLPSLLDMLDQKFEYVILDTPPLLPVADSVVIAKFVDAIFLTIRIREGSKVASEKAVERLASARAKIQGVIVNGLKPSHSEGFLDSEKSLYGCGLSARYGAANAYGDSHGLHPAKIKPSQPV